MSDEADRPEFLTGRERRLANLRPFQKGNTFGKGRPKDLARFGDILMGEFYKTILASLAGKTVNKTQGEIVALEMVERHPDGPAAMLMLLKFIEAHEARQAAREALEGQVGGQRPGLKMSARIVRKLDPGHIEEVANGIQAMGFSAPALVGKAIIDGRPASRPLRTIRPHVSS